MKKNIYIIIGIGAVVIVGGWFMASNGFWLVNIKENNTFLETTEKGTETKKEVELIIDNGEKEPITSKADFTEGMTALGLLEKEILNLALNLRTKTYSTGAFIDSIGNKENGQDGKYWLYYVNGELPMVAADKQQIKPGDKIEFRFEKSPF